MHSHRILDLSPLILFRENCEDVFWDVRPQLCREVRDKLQERLNCEDLRGVVCVNQNAFNEILQLNEDINIFAVRTVEAAEEVVEFLKDLLEELGLLIAPKGDLY